MLPCPKCKTTHHVKVEPDAAGYEYQCYCHGCYDADMRGDPPTFYSLSIVGYGRNPNEAVESWDEQVEMEE
jgi:hypothetical protein